MINVNGYSCVKGFSPRIFLQEFRKLISNPDFQNCFSVYMSQCCHFYLHFLHSLHLSSFCAPACHIQPVSSNTLTYCSPSLHYYLFIYYYIVTTVTHLLPDHYLSCARLACIFSWTEVLLLALPDLDYLAPAPVAHTVSTTSFPSDFIFCKQKRL